VNVVFTVVFVLTFLHLIGKKGPEYAFHFFSDFRKHDFTFFWSDVSKSRKKYL